VVKEAVLTAEILLRIIKRHSEDDSLTVQVPDSKIEWC